MEGDDDDFTKDEDDQMKLKIKKAQLDSETTLNRKKKVISIYYNILFNIRKSRRHSRKVSVKIRRRRRR